MLAYLPRKTSTRIYYEFLYREDEKWYLKDFPMPLAWKEPLAASWPVLFAYGAKSRDLMRKLGACFPPPSPPHFPSFTSLLLDENPNEPCSTLEIQGHVRSST